MNLALILPGHKDGASKDTKKKSRKKKHDHKLKVLPIVWDQILIASLFLPQVLINKMILLMFPYNFLEA